MEAIVLAGGLGTRLRDAVPDVPKPMAPVKNAPFLAHLLNYWISHGVTRVILSVGYKGEVIREYFGECYKGIAIDYAVEGMPLGTGGGLLLATKHLREQGPLPGVLAARTHLFVASECKLSPSSRIQEMGHNGIRVLEIPELDEMMRMGKIQDHNTLVAYYRYRDKLGRL